jgi:hypothetical protein
MVQRFTEIKTTPDGFEGRDRGRNFRASYDLFLIREAWQRGADFEQLVDGFGEGAGTMGDWSSIRDSTPSAKAAMLQAALNHIFGTDEKSFRGSGRPALNRGTPAAKRVVVGGNDSVDARGLVLAENGANKLPNPVFLWSRNPSHGRAHIVCLEPNEAEGRTLCGLQRLVRPMGDPYARGDEEARFKRDACTACVRAAPASLRGGRGVSSCR